ncbi:hypothetical protein AAHH80_34230, partial [Burkholderia pseudomallei]
KPFLVDMFPVIDWVTLKPPEEVSVSVGFVITMQQGSVFGVGFVLVDVMEDERVFVFDVLVADLERVIVV